MRTVILFFEGNAPRIDYFKPLLLACCSDHDVSARLETDLQHILQHPVGGLRISVEDGKIIGGGYNERLVSPYENETLGWFERPEAFIDMATCSMVAMLGSDRLSNLHSTTIISSGLWSEFAPLGLTDQSGTDFSDMELTQRSSFSHEMLFTDANVYPQMRGTPHEAVCDAQRTLLGRPREPRPSIADESTRRAATRPRRATPVDKRYGIHPVQSLRSVEALPLPR